MTRHSAPSCETQPARAWVALRGELQHGELLLEAALLARRRARLQPLDRRRLGGSTVPMSERAAVHDAGAAAPDDGLGVVRDVLRPQRHRHRVHGHRALDPVPNARAVPQTQRAMYYERNESVRRGSRMDLLWVYLIRSKNLLRKKLDCDPLPLWDIWADLGPRAFLRVGGVASRSNTPIAERSLGRSPAEAGSARTAAVRLLPRACGPARPATDEADVFRLALRGFVVLRDAATKTAHRPTATKPTLWRQPLVSYRWTSLELSYRSIYSCFYRHKPSSNIILDTRYQPISVRIYDRKRSLRNSRVINPVASEHATVPYWCCVAFWKLWLEGRRDQQAHRGTSVVTWNQNEFPARRGEIKAG